MPLFYCELRREDATVTEGRGCFEEIFSFSFFCTDFIEQKNVVHLDKEMERPV